MKRIVLEETGTGRQVALDAGQVQSVLDELRRTAANQSGAVAQPARMAPDCRVTIRDGTAVQVFELHGRTVLRNVKSRRERQFYMGLLLLEWLR